MKEQRRHFRAKTVNLLSYECVDKDGFRLTQGMGRILDISQGGLLMETRVSIEAKYILLMSLDIKEELIKIKGEVVYCREPEPKTFHTGVRFIETSEKIRETVAAMIKVFLHTKME
jgi:c-di-GMP-binding flagellar brake protein YcgR